MTRAFLDLPGPADGPTWCMVCCALYKGAIETEYPELVQQIRDLAADEHGPERIKVIRPKAPRTHPLPSAAVTWGVSPIAVALGVGPLCWTHLGGMSEARPDQNGQGHAGPGLYRGGTG